MKTVDECCHSEPENAKKVHDNLPLIEPVSDDEMPDVVEQEEPLMVTAPKPRIVFQADQQQLPPPHNNRHVFHGPRRLTLSDQISQFFPECCEGL